MKRDIGLVNAAVVRRWPTKKDMRRKIMERLCKAAVEDADPEVWIPAARVAINADKPSDQRQATTINVGVAVQNNQPARIEEDDNWYGNAHRLVTESTDAPDTDSVESRQIQNGSVRPTLGQNGNGTNGHH